MTRKIFLLISIFIYIAILSLTGCANDDDDKKDVAADGYSLGSQELTIGCPDQRIEEAKTFLVDAQGDAARQLFLNILSQYRHCTKANFGVVLADQLRLMTIIDEMLRLLFEPIGDEKGVIDFGEIVVDYVENLLEPIVVEMLEHLSACQADGEFSFELTRLPLSLLDLDFLVYSGKYDRGDILLQLFEFNLFAAGMDTILSYDLSFDFQIILDRVPTWGGMDLPAIIIDVVDMLLEILDDPDFPNFLGLRDDGFWRLPQAGLKMGHAFQHLHDGVAELRGEAIDEEHDVTGCGDRNQNGLCEAGEFIHGLFYSLPSGLHWELQQVNLSLRNSYWDETDLDINPGAPDPFLLNTYNPVLSYLGLPPILPAIKIDLGGFYAKPDPGSVRNPFRKILELIQKLLDRIKQDRSSRADQPTEAQVEEHPGPGKGDVPQGPPAPGLATTTDIAALPYLLPTARSFQQSSHDPTGGNDDGFTPPNHHYIDEHGEFVLFDQYGPGCIYRMQYTHTWTLIGNLRIYVDDMEVPVIEGPFWLLFFSAFEPLKKPLVSNLISASGTSFTYLPIPFKERCRITVNVPPEFFGITYVQYDADTEVTSYTGQEDYSLMQAQFNNVGEDPKPEVPSFPSSGSTTLDPGESFAILNRSGPGAVWQMFLEPEPFDQEVIQNLWLTARWDDAQDLGIEAPVNEFFGSYYIEDTPKTLMMGKDGDTYYSYFPMPFWQKATMILENRGAEPIDIKWRFRITEQAYEGRAGYFKALYHEENPVPVGRDYHIAVRQRVAGKFIGLTHTMRGPLGRWYLEGDERYYTDGSLSPAIHGTGTEDYYNGGWYFLMGTFAEPLTGNPSHHQFSEYDHTGAYRLHLFDAVHYLDGVRLGIEHGAANTGATEHYSSVAYFYESYTSWLDLTDELDVGDQASESAHGYSATGSGSPIDLASYYEGEDDEAPVKDSGRNLTGKSTFSVAVDPANEGVLLRRRYDQKLPRQQAKVSANGVEAGTWYSPESSRKLRFAESEMVLAPSLTKGKSTLIITVEAEGEVPWTEYYYRVYSILTKPIIGAEK